MNPDRTAPILATCPKGLTPFLLREISALGLIGHQELAAGVLTEGTLHDCMRLNLHLRTAHRVMYELASFRARTPADLYRRLSRMAWEELIGPDEQLTVSSATRTPAITDGRFANQKVKDAVVDRIRDKTGRRPDAGPRPVGVCLFLHWEGDRATISIDTTGEPLTRRGWRTMPHTAPLQETLAAACVLASPWAGQAAAGRASLVNPMCGSGTLAIEAALLAANRAPGLTRDDFAFTHLLGFDRDGWQAMLAQARDAAIERPDVRILASDIDPAAMEAARHNAKQANVDHLIEFATCDFRETEVPPPPGTVLMNPEYGRRLGNEDELAETYRELGDFFKQRCAGYTACVITGNLELAKRVGLRAKRRIPLWNAAIECRLLVYEMYAGSRKTGRDEGPERPA